MPHQIFYDILDSLDLTIIYIIDKFCVVCLTCESFHSNDTDNFLNLFPLLTSVNLKVQMYKAYKNKGMCMCGWLVDYTLCNCPHTTTWYVSSNFATKEIVDHSYETILLLTRSTFEIGKEFFFFLNLSLKRHRFVLAVHWGHWQNSVMSQYELTHLHCSHGSTPSLRNSSSSWSSLKMSRVLISNYNQYLHHYPTTYLSGTRS